MRILDIRPEEDIPRVMAAARAPDTPEFEGGVWRHRTKDGREILVEVATHAITVLDRPARLTLAHDVTERKRAERELRQTADTLQTLIWALSAHHTAVNFPQYHFLAYVPNRPDSLFAWMPEGTEDIDLSFILAALPNPQISHFQISFAYLLSLPSEYPLTTVDAMAEQLPGHDRRWRRRHHDRRWRRRHHDRRRRRRRRHRTHRHPRRRPHRCRHLPRRRRATRLAHSNGECPLLSFQCSNCFRIRLLGNQ